MRSSADDVGNKRCSTNENKREIDRFIKQFFNEMSDSEMSRALNVSQSYISKRRNAMGIVRPKGPVAGMMCVQTRMMINEAMAGETSLYFLRQAW